MEFDEFSVIDIIRIGIENTIEYITRDTFSIVNAIYDSKNNTYKLLKTEKNFNNTKDFKKYLSSYKNQICKLYKSDYIKEENKLGTLLLDFLKYDFSNFDSYCTFIHKYGLPGLRNSLNSRENFKNPFDDCQKLNIINNENNTFYTEEDFIKVCQNTFKKRSESLIYIQSIFYKILKFINNLSSLDYLQDLSIAERFYVYQKSDLLQYLAISTGLFFNTTISYDIDLMKDLDKPQIPIFDDFENTSKSLVKYMKSNPQEFNKNPSIFITFNCPVVETVCLLSILHLVQTNTSVAICKNCGNYFIPSSKKNTLYCDNIFEHGKTCQEIGAMITYNEKLKNDEINALYRKTLSAKKMLANRNPDIPIYLEKYEKWKKEANKFKKDIREGLRTQEDFKNWIEETRKKY